MPMRNWSDVIARGPRTRRAIIVLGWLLCVALAIGGAYALGLLDRIGALR